MQLFTPFTRGLASSTHLLRKRLLPTFRSLSTWSLTRASWRSAWANQLKRRRQQQHYQQQQQQQHPPKHSKQRFSSQSAPDTSTSASTSKSIFSFQGGRQAAQVVESNFPTLTRLRALKVKFPVLPASILGYLGHAGYVFSLVGYLVTDILWFRAMMVCGQICGIFFNLCRQYPILLPVRWGLLFLGINGVQIAILLNQRRQLQLTPNQAMLYARSFKKHKLTPYQFMKLMDVGVWIQLAAGEKVTVEGEPNHRLLLINSGQVEVLVDGHRVAEMAPGDFIGEMTLLPGVDVGADSRDMPATATVVTTSPSEMYAWDHEELREFFAEHPDIQKAVMETLTEDVVGKLSRQHQSQRIENYRLVLSVALAGKRIEPEALEFLRNYPVSHKIPEEQVQTVLAHMLAKYEWTPEQFARGRR